MEEKTINTQAEEVKTATETTEQTLGEISNPEVKQDPKTVGLDKFLDIKRENKELRNQLSELANRIEQGENKQDIAQDLEELAEEHQIDKSFLNKLAKSIEKRAEERLEATLSQKLEPITKVEREKQFNDSFNKALNRALEQMPEYKDVVNENTIKALATSPLNANKTMTQIIEETYSNNITGKGNIETTKVNGGKEPDTLDYEKAKNDADYFKEIMSNPKLKKEYNEKNLSEVAKYL